MPPLGDLRIRLDQMTERIVSRLKDRSRFPLNALVYQRDSVPIKGRAGISFLEFALEGLEAYHASLGRYHYPDQHRISESNATDSPVARTVTMPAVPRVTISTRDDLFRFYQDLLRRLCAPGQDPNTFGETVYVDSEILQLLNERVNLGRYVAEAKRVGEPALLDIVDHGQLAARLRDPGREAAVLARAREVAARYELDPDLVAEVFQWLVEETLAVEIAYLRGLPNQAK